MIACQLKKTIEEIDKMSCDELDDWYIYFLTHPTLEDRLDIWFTTFIDVFASRKTKDMPMINWANLHRNQTYISAEKCEKFVETFKQLKNKVNNNA